MKQRFMGGGMARIPKLLLGVLAMTYMLMAGEDIKLPKEDVINRIDHCAAWYDKYVGTGGVHIFNMRRIAGTYDYECEFQKRLSPGGSYLSSWTQTRVVSSEKVILNPITKPKYSSCGYTVDLKKGTLSLYAWYDYYGGHTTSWTISLF
ncbi:Uncharacterised protein [Campylobacter hyointestinalis subsp. hyointestinalis]|uniref:Uncharacterized protein n=2 Tax=Campylobacter hyointestinalis TaxID=198 RepID=A0A9W5AQJ5_CAMHY|nr:hypothetical protein [Campylobacter hyointestinalis]CUU77295.1 Uncharacterised protein [Campylobacter hyointestinalis subsp. hyointestinalis]